MIVFFMIVYSVPFFIETTFMSAANRFDPFLLTLKGLEETGDKAAFSRGVTMFLNNQFTSPGGFPLVKFESDWYTFDDGYEDKLRTMEKLIVERYGYRLVVNYTYTAGMYGFFGIIAYAWVTVCLIVVSLYIDNDVVR